MRIKKSITWACALSALAPISARADVFTFQPDNGIWNRDDNWRNENEENGTPGPNDVAIIPPAKFCNIDVADVEAAAIQIERVFPDGPGHLRITQGSTLKLHGDATHSTIIDGSLDFMDKSGQSDPATLIIMNDIEMDGVGSLLAGAFITLTHVGVIKGDPNAATPPVLTITRDTDTLGVKIHGTFDIEVKLVNDGFVAARGLNVIIDKIMTLKGEPKSGSGSWGARDFADLVVDVAVTGSAKWRVGDSHTPGLIVINEPLAVYGDVEVIKGGLTVTENFCTTGDITWTSGKILVVEGATPVSAVFGAASCP